jgi:TIR domain
LRKKRKRASISTREAQGNVLAIIPTPLYNESTTQEVINVADQHQLEVLQQGPDAWNTWKQQHPTTQPDLSHADLSGANLSYARVRSIQFINIDVRTVRGLETVEHTGPSSIGIETIYRSQGAIPEVFLRKAGVPEDFLTYMRSLMNHPIEYYTCFISYTSRDQDFAERLYADLQNKGVRCWFAPENMRTGDRIRQRIDKSIRLYDKLLLVLSEHSITSSWVEFEVEAALAKENSRNSLVLFPIRLDNSVMESQTSWAAHIRRMRHITDFSRWKQHPHYQKALFRLLRDLQPDTDPKGGKHYEQC